MDLKVFFILGVLVSNLPSEPTEEYLIKDYVDTFIGLYFREYSIDNHGAVNYVTARHVPSVIYESPEDNDKIFADEHPLFYWFDWNQNGKFDVDEQWKDEEELGVHVIPFMGTVSNKGN